MIEFKRAYSTPLAQRQFELEQMIKFYETRRAENFSKLFYSIAVGFGYLLLMGIFVGYGRFDGGYLVCGVLTFLTLAFVLLGRFTVPWVETRHPNLRKKHADWIK